MTARQRLPNHRPQLTQGIRLGDARYDVSIGFDLTTGAPLEVFITGPKPGSGMAFILADASVLISLALQHGVSPSVLAHSMARAPNPEDDDPASAIGAAIDLLRAVEREIAVEIEALRPGAPEGNRSRT